MSYQIKQEGGTVKKIRHQVRLLGLLSVVCVVVLGITTPARSITINLTFNSGVSDSPSFDSTGALLQPIMQAAANFWEDIIEDAGTLNIEYYYDNLSDPNNTLAVHNNLATSGGKPTSARIRVDTQLNGVNRLWFFDPTPTDNSEYDLQQTLYRDLSATNQSGGGSAWFNGAPPDLLEVGYRGNTAAGAPANAVNGFDLLSTVIHEIGHAVGLTGNVTAPETNDGDYDVNTAFVNGAVMGILDNTNHIAPRVSLMCSGCGATNLRRMPTATDVFAAAAAAGWTQIDLPRQDFLGGVNWGTAGNWEANQVPGAADWAFLRNGGNIQLNVNDIVAQLFVGEGTDLFTNTNRLDVNGTVTVEHDGVAVRPQIFVETSGELEANRLDLNGGELDMSGGLADINGTLDMNDTNGFLGRITGNGTVDVLTRLNNDGDILADGGTLTFTTTGGAVWNLDGAGNGVVSAINGNINFASGTMTDAFDGQMNVGVGRNINFANGWELGSGGNLTLGGGTIASDRAEVSGNAVIRGDILVDKRGELDGTLTIYSSSTVDMPDADDRLDLGNATSDTITYNGGSFTGNGTLVQDGDATVTAGNTVNISVNNFDLDGDTISDTTILAGATMNITGSGLTDAADGVITINSGTLNVATGNVIDFGGFPLFIPVPWTMDGSLIFLDNGVNPELNGSKVNITGAVSVPITGTGVINAQVEFSSTSTTEITSASDKLELNGLTTYSGGSYTGFGTIQQNGNATISAATTIAVGKFDMDGSVGTTTITLNSDLTVNSTNIDSFGDVFNGTIVISDSSSELTINTAAPWTMAGTLNVTTGTIFTFPSIDGQDFTLSGTANIDGGTRFDARVDLTGSVVLATATSTLAVLGGDLASTNTINGGTVTGPAGSKLRTTSGNALVGNGTIGVRLDFLAGSELLADNGTLNVPGNFISMGVIGTNDSDGVLNVTTSWNTNTATELQLNGGSVTGASITNGGLTTGTGTIATTGGFSNDGVLTATGGAITLTPAGVMDLDGGTETGTVNVISDVIVNTTNLDAGDNVFNGTINVTSLGGELQVNTASPWTMAGTFNAATGTNLTFPSITGQDFTLSGTANVDGGTRFDAKVNLTGSVVLATATSTLAVLGGDIASPNTINGGTITGPAGSKLRTTGGHALVGNGTIAVAVDFLASSELLADDGTLNVPGNFVSMDVIGTNDVDGILNVTTAWNTNTATELQLNGGSVTGGSITNGGLTVGFGTIAPGGFFSNENILAANLGELVLNPGGALDLDGVGNTGTVNAIAGDVRVAKNVGIAGFGGTLNVGAGQSFTMDFGGLSNSGQVNLAGGDIVMPSFSQFGTMTVGTAASGLDAASSFEAGSNTTLNADLNLLGDALVSAGAGFNGAATLNIMPGTTLTALDGAVISVTVDNDGGLVIGSSPGTLVVNDYVQTAAGMIEIELQGLNQGVTYDWLKVGDNATLAGLLDVSLIGGYVPVIGDSFDILSAGTGIAGVFDSILFPAIPNIGLGVSYTANIVTLNAGLLGDLDGDGFVGISDLNIVLGAWNNNVTPGVWIVGDPSGDGFIGIDDLNVVLGNWNAGTPPLVDASNVIPEPGALGLMTLGVLGLVRRRG